VTVKFKNNFNTYTSKLRGFFNVYNMSALIAGAYGLGMDPQTIQKAFGSVTTVAGRMDRVMIDAPFAVIVDYAHTPDALVNILATSRPLTSGRLICVFGCGGDRDKTKRPIMGGVVSEYADEAIVTSDNPRSERPVAIIDQISAGIPLDFPHVAIPDRKSAIKYALESAKAGDCVVIAGKGHEDYQEINGVRHHFNDKEVVEELYSQLGKI
jgi:UDP-N-acetylmuramoyl-L-alanyl-D-glutamate--2,6-diaminopimelate ligase